MKQANDEHGGLRFGGGNPRYVVAILPGATPPSEQMVIQVLAWTISWQYKAAIPLPWELKQSIPVPAPGRAEKFPPAVTQQLRHFEQTTQFMPVHKPEAGTFHVNRWYSMN